MFDELRVLSHIHSNIESFVELKFIKGEYRRQKKMFNSLKYFIIIEHAHTNKQTIKTLT